MALTSIVDTAVRGVENLGDSINGALFEPVIRLGVTGLARSGKTVFITSLVANLLDRGRMQGLLAERDGRIEAAYLQPQPDDTVPRFDYETHLSALTGQTPHWPDSTRAISELRLSLRVRPSGLLSGIQGPRVIHLDIVDYPGEWLLDLTLLDKSFDTWSNDAMRLAQKDDRKDLAVEWLTYLETLKEEPEDTDEAAQNGAAIFTKYLAACRTEERALSMLPPGRFLMPGDMAGSPALTFFPRKSVPSQTKFRFDDSKTRCPTALKIVAFSYLKHSLFSLTGNRKTSFTPSPFGDIIWE